MSEINIHELRRLLAEATERPWESALRALLAADAESYSLCIAAVNALPALLAAVEALNARHEFECGCDSPGTPSVCVSDPVDESKPLAAFSFEEQA